MRSKQRRLRSTRRKGVEIGDEYRVEFEAGGGEVEGRGENALSEATVNKITIGTAIGLLSVIIGGVAIFMRTTVLLDAKLDLMTSRMNEVYAELVDCRERSAALREQMARVEARMNYIEAWMRERGREQHEQGYMPFAERIPETAGYREGEHDQFGARTERSP